MQKPMLDRDILAKWLGDIISEEMKKSDDEIDWDLVDECEAFLAELYSDVVISEEQMTANIAKIKAKTCTTSSPKTSRKPRMRRVFAAGLAAAIILCSAVTAYAFVPSFRNMVQCVLKLDQGESIEDGGITYIHGGTMQSYSSMEVLMNNEVFDFSLPIITSDSLKLKTILCDDASNTTVLCFDDTSIRYEIWLNNTEIETYLEIATEYTFKHTTYIVTKENSGIISYGSYTLIDNDIHVIVANNIETIELLVNSIS